MTPIYIPRIIVVALSTLVLTLALVAGAGAQNGGPAIAITRVDSQGFPKVTAYVTVSGEDGWTPLGLTKADFSILEDGVAVPAASIAVESDTSQGLYLVLALDLSMNAAPLAEVKEATLAFIDTLGSADKIAVIAFYDEVSVVQDFTNNKEVLRAAINALTAKGNYTALNEAAFEAVNMAGALPTGRKAVVMLTNSRDNISTISTDKIIDEARSANTPIYIIGFDKARPDVLEAITTATGGRSFVLSKTIQIQDSFQAIGGLLEQGNYAVTFKSGLKADNAEHNLVISVTQQGKQVQATGRFVAVTSQVTVSLPDLAEGQTVRGIVNLAVQITATTPISSVEYLLNGRSLATVTTPPYGFKWDSTSLEPGTYHLTAKVVDQAGNQGQAEVNLKVVRPLSVTVSTSQTEIKSGDQFTVESEVETLAEVVRVEFLLDGKFVGSDDTPPYRFSFDSGAYPPGEHIITVHAEDSLGWKAEANLPVRFLAPPAPQPTLSWRALVERLRLGELPRSLAVVGVIAVAFGVVVVFFIGLVIIVRSQKQRFRKTFRLEISNLGNVRSSYALRAEDPVSALKFQFAVHGVVLPQRAVPQVTKVAAEAVAEAPPARPAPPSLPISPGGGGARQAARSEGGGALQTADQAMGTASGIAGIVSSIASLLPGSMGAPLQRAVSPVYQTQMQVSGTRLQAQSQIGQATSVSDKVARAKPASAPQKPGLPPAPQVQEEQPAFAADTTQPSRAVARPRAALVTTAPQPVAETWVQTPFLAPGETLTIDLLIAPLNPYRTQDYSFKLISRALGQEGAPLAIEEGNVRIVGISWFRRLLPFLIFAIVTITIMSLAVAFLLYVNQGLLSSIPGIT
jgi:VWFA-related protein